MIASIRGTVAGLLPEGVVVVVGGVGLAVSTTAATRVRLRRGEEVEMSTSLVVREDSLTLYGFAEADERDLFALLQTASGVGPRLALAVLSVHTPDDVRRSIATEDLAALTQVPGIGRKGAQRLVLELKDKVGAVGGAAHPTGGAGWRSTLTEALGGLGFPAQQVDDAVASLAAEHPAATEADVPVLLKQGLALLGRSR